MKKKLLASGIAAALTTLAGSAGAAGTDLGHVNVIPYYSVQEGNVTNISIVNPDLRNGKAVKIRFRGAEWSDDVLDFTVFLSPGDKWTAAVGQINGAGSPRLISNDSTCTSPSIPSSDDGGVPFNSQRLDTASQTTGYLEGYVEVIVLADIPPIRTQGERFDVSSTSTLLPPTWSETTDNKQTLYNAIKHPNTQGSKPACKTSTTAQQLIDTLVEDNWWVWHTGGDASYAVEVHAAASSDGFDTADFLAQPDALQFGTKRFVAHAEWAAASHSIDGVAIANPDKVTAYSAVAAVAAADDWLQPSTKQNGVNVYSIIVNPASSRVFTTPALVIDEEITPIKLFFEQNDHSVGLNSPRKSRDYVDAYAQVTADRIFYSDTIADHEGTGLPLLQFDLPDLSTPNTAAVASGTVVSNANWGEGSYGPAFERRAVFANAIRNDAGGFAYVSSDFTTSGGASTDVVFSQPLRRYYYQYAVANPPVAGQTYHRTFTWTGTTYQADITGDKGTSYESLLGASNSIPVPEASYLDSEEYKPTASGGAVFSPAPAGQPYVLYGEVSVLEINGTSGNSKALGAKLTKVAVDTGSITDGWIALGITPVNISNSISTVPHHTHSAGNVGLPLRETNSQTLPTFGFTAINYTGNVSRSIVLPFRYVDLNK